MMPFVLKYTTNINTQGPIYKTHHNIITIEVIIQKMEGIESCGHLSPKSQPPIYYNSLYHQRPGFESCRVILLLSRPHYRQECMCDVTLK